MKDKDVYEVIDELIKNELENNINISENEIFNKELENNFKLDEEFKKVQEEIDSRKQSKSHFKN